MPFNAIPLLYVIYGNGKLDQFRNCLTGNRDEAGMQVDLCGYEAVSIAAHLALP